MLITFLNGFAFTPDATLLATKLLTSGRGIVNNIVSALEKCCQQFLPQNVTNNIVGNIFANKVIFSGNIVRNIVVNTGFCYRPMSDNKLNNILGFLCFT